MNGVGIIFKSTDWRLNITLSLRVQGLNHGCLPVSKVIGLTCFGKMWRILLPRILKNNDLQYLLKRRGGLK